MLVLPTSTATRGYLEVLRDGLPETVLCLAVLFLVHVQPCLSRVVERGGASLGVGQLVSQGHLCKLYVCTCTKCMLYELRHAFKDFIIEVYK